MGAGRLKRAAFMVGVVALLVGAGVLIDPVARAGRNCGSAFIPKKVVIPTVARVCEETLRGRRVVGGPILLFGIVAIAATGFRCLVEPDGHPAGSRGALRTGL